MKPDVKKSIAKGKIYFERCIFDKGIRLFFFIYFAFILPIIASICLPDLFKHDTIGQIIVNVASIGFSAFMILKVTSPNTLKMTRVSNYAIRKENITQAIRQLKWDIAFDDPNYLIVIPNSIYHQISIINAGNDFLISSVIFSRHYTFAFSEKKYLNILLNKIGYTPANQALKLTVGS
jgi:hypothetical protein